MNLEYKRVDFQPEEIKLLDFDNLTLNEKHYILAIDATACESLDVSYKNYEEGKLSLYKDGEIWKTYYSQDGKIYNEKCYENLSHACEYLLSLTEQSARYVHYDLILDRSYDEEIINNGIENIKERYKTPKKAL